RHCMGSWRFMLPVSVPAGRECQIFCVRGVFTLTHHWVSKLYPANDMSGKVMMLADPCSLVRSKRLFLRPDLPLYRQSRAGPVKFAAQRAGPEPRAAPAWGEHGEDPQFDWAEHGAMLRPGGASLLLRTQTLVRPPG